MNETRLIIRIVCLAILCYGWRLWGTDDEFVARIDGRYGYRYAYLTHIGIVLTIATNLISLLDSWAGRPRTRQIKRHLLGIVIPIETLICLMYWVLHFWDRKLVSPLEIPLPTNLALHVVPTVYTWFELWCIRKDDRLFSRYHIALLVVFNYLYLLWCYALSSANGSWPYLLLREMSGVQRICLVTATSAASVAVYCLACALQSRLRPKRTPGRINRK